MPVKIKVRYLAAVADYTGRESEELEIEDGLTVGELRKLILERYPSLSRLERRFKILVLRNGLNARDDEVLRDGDKIAFLPPVSGG